MPLTTAFKPRRRRIVSWLLGGALGCVFLRAVPADAADAAGADYDVVVRGGTVYDGRGGAAFVADVAIAGDRVARIGDLSGARGKVEIDARGLAVAPGFINMLSWADEALLVDGRSTSDIVQGVTLEVFGEGTSMGPLNDAMRERKLARQSDLRYDVPWTTLGGYLEHLEARGVATNVASFVGAGTVREFVLGEIDRPPTAQELARMQDLVRQAMREGALGVGSSLPYVPGTFASTEELIALSRAAAESDGLYITHLRDEGAKLLDSLDEFLRIVREARIRGEVYHFKVSGKANWHLFDAAIAKLEAARAAGLPVTADMYPYPASSTGMTINLPSWAQEGGHAAMIARLKDPALRPKVIADMTLIPPEDLLLSSFRNPSLRPLIGKTLAQVARERGKSPEETALDLIVEDDSRVGTVRFTMSKDNVAKAIALPWVSFGSDSGSIAPEPPFTESQPHPRTYGTFARVLGRAVREEGRISLTQAVHRLTELPATNLRLDHRGLLAAGYFADLVVFDPARVADLATYEKPHQLAIGVKHVLVNGVPVLRDGAHTGARPGRFVRGPGAVDPATRTTATANGKLSDTARLLDTWIEEQRQYQEIPGVAVAVMRGDEVLYAKAFGARDTATGAPLTTDTPFRLGSVSKVFTASAVMKLVEQGKLRLDDPVTQHLPWFKPKNPYADKGIGIERITIEHLLTHTSGLPREGAFPYWTTHTFPTREALAASLPTQQLFSVPGTTYRYSNLGVALLGQVIETVTKKSYAEFLRGEILDPLGMSATTAAPDAATIARLSRAYQRKPDGGVTPSAPPRPLMDYYDTGVFAPMGGVVSTLDDLTKFARLQLTADAAGTPSSARPAPLAPQTLAAMHRARFVYPSFTGGRGLGFAVSRRDDHTYVTHGGWIGGHRADLIVDPARNLSAVALTNADDASPGLFARKALDEFAEALAPPPTVATAQPSADWRKYFGTYTDPWGWQYEVLVLDGGLALYEHNYPPEDDPDDGVTRLTPMPDLGPHTFKMGDGELVVFEVAADGSVPRMRRRYDFLDRVR
jgi:N-acyl-D-amino-acid deacylase